MCIHVCQREVPAEAREDLWIPMELVLTGGFELLATGAGNGPLFLLEPNALLTSESEQCFLSTLFETGTSFR